MGRELLPAWDGKPVSPGEAEPLRVAFQRLPRRLQQTLLGRRVAGVLDFLHRRRSAAGLDDHIRTQADSDAIALESGGTLVRFITWAIPILGFLGTVLGVTDAVAGITPEMLEHSLSSVTDGLALAFDTTAPIAGCGAPAGGAASGRWRFTSTSTPDGPISTFAAGASTTRIVAAIVL